MVKLACKGTATQKRCQRLQRRKNVLQVGKLAAGSMYTHNCVCCGGVS